MRFKPRTIESKVLGFEGECRIEWANNNQAVNRLDGGVCVFAKLVKRNRLGWPCKYGKTFHGIIKNGKTFIEDTADVISAREWEKQFE